MPRKKKQGEQATQVANAPLFFIGTCAQENVDMTTCLCIQSLRLTGHNFVWIVLGVGGNARTKNVLMTQFVRQEWGVSPYLIFLDRDIVFDMPHIDMLLEDLQAGYNYVGGCYPVKDASQLASHDPEGITFDRTVKPIRWLASGFAGVTRQLLQKMIKQLDLPLLHRGENIEFYPFGEQIRYKTPEDTWMWLSEDYDFCNKVREIGEEAYLDTRITVGHVSAKLVTVNDVVKYQAKEKEDDAIPIEKLLGGANC